MLVAWMQIGMAPTTFATDTDRREPPEWLELPLSVEQQAWLDFVRRCHRDNRYSPYLLALDAQQRSAIEALGQYPPGRLVVFDQRPPAQAVDIRLSHALRISDTDLRVRLETLADEATLLRYERKIIGWEENPLPKRWSRLDPEARRPGAQPPCE